MTPTENAMAASVPGWLSWFLAIYPVIQDLVWPVLASILWYGVTLLRKHGYRTTYAEAIIRAMGAGVQAATANGMDPFSVEGRKVVAREGAKYLADKVGKAAAALGITTEAEHAERVDAQLGTVIAAAQAAIAVAPAITALSEEVTSGQGSLPLPKIILGGH